MQQVPRGLRPYAVVGIIVAGSVLVVCSAQAKPRGLRRPRQSVAGPLLAADGIGRPDASLCNPHRETLNYHGGDLVANPDIFLLFWGSQWSSDAEHIASKAALINFYASVPGSGYDCAWREYARPGHSLNAPTFNGSFVISGTPPGLLSDSTIQAEIQSQVMLGNAPARTDDRVYFVIPEKGVVVESGGETGCGGPRFTFCGYHDSFGTLAARFRYAVLPYPCNSGGGTCFVDPLEDPGASLQAVGSHELTEMVTDPDSDPLGGSGWFSNRSGNENADICASGNCTDTLTVGMSSYPVNPAWSNLAKGCVTSVPCSATPECTDGAPGLCALPTKNPVSSCAFEWQVNPNLTLHKGFPTAKVTCTDGQAFCDSDGVQDGACTFQVAACVNNTDPRVSCTHVAIASLSVLKPIPASSDPTDAANSATLLGALQNIDAHSAGALSGATVNYMPAAATADSCTGFMTLVVPVGKRSFTVRLASGSGNLFGKLRLVCKPTPP